jgi:HlyD family secretion protein
MFKTYFWIIFLLALASIGFIAVTMWNEMHQTVVASQPKESYPKTPFTSHIAGLGIVEASGDNIAISAPLNRIVEQVLVKVGQDVTKDQVLMRLEDRDLQAELLTRQAAYAIAVAQLQKLKALPRAEDVKAAEATLAGIDVELEQARQMVERVQGLTDIRALSRQEIDQRRYTYEQIQAKQQQQQAVLSKIKSGTWQPDLEIARLEALQARANMERAKTEIARTIIRSPLDGKILQVNVHDGEFASAANPTQPLMVIGDTSELCLEVSINQFDAPLFRPEATAVAVLRGSPKQQYPLRFMHLEPYLINKRNVTQNIQERVDTRVLQVTYCFEPPTPNLLVGQQMDVFIDAELEP